VLDSQQLQSDINGRLGEWIAIGSIDNTSASQESSWTAQGKSDAASTTSILLKVDTLD
jgi:hypothetical protein